MKHIAIRYLKICYFAWAKLHGNVSAATGACMAIKSSVFEEGDDLDENLTAVLNDIGLCLKALTKDYKYFILPFAEFHHYESKIRKHATPKGQD